jgi:hypothetical protein
LLKIVTKPTVHSDSVGKPLDDSNDGDVIVFRRSRYTKPSIDNTLVDKLLHENEPMNLTQYVMVLKRDNAARSNISKRISKYDVIIVLIIS